MSPPLPNPPPINSSANHQRDPTAEEEDKDNMEEIDPDNIISERRTRGKTIDFAKAAEEAGDELDDDDDDEDDDFEEEEEGDHEMKD